LLRKAVFVIRPGKEEQVIGIFQAEKDGKMVI
jgi:hypothetical protein